MKIKYLKDKNYLYYKTTLKIQKYPKETKEF